MSSQGPCIEICQGPECGEFGGPELLDELRSLGIAAEPGHCQGLCHYAPVAVVGEKHLGDATLCKIRQQFDE